MDTRKYHIENQREYDQRNGIHRLSPESMEVAKKEGDVYAVYKFDGFHGANAFSRENYSQITGGPLTADDTLDTIRARHSLPPTSVIELRQSDELTAWYVDRAAFSKIHGFFTEQAPTLVPPPEYEPAFYKNMERDSLRDELIQRLTDNLQDYLDKTVNNESINLAGAAPQVAAYATAFYFATEEYSFDKSELEYLLLFKNPLSVIADSFEVAGVDDHSEIMHEIFDTEDALHSNYALMSDHTADETLSDQKALTAICRNGEILPGDTVLSIKDIDYSCLVGTVLYIDKAGTPDHQTDNDGDDIHVNFMVAEYSENRMLEIQDMLWDLDGRPTPPKPGVLPPLDIDDVIMAPDMLIRITDVEREVMTDILDSGKKAEAFCDHVLGDKEAMLKHELFERLDANMLAYRNSMINESNKETLFDFAEDIANRYTVRECLKTSYDFKTGEVEYLLQFSDPLSLVADRWPDFHELGGVSDIVGDILEDRDSHGHYARVMDADHPASKESARPTADGDRQSVIARIREAARAPKKPRADKPDKTRNDPER